MPTAYQLFPFTPCGMVDSLICSLNINKGGLVDLDYRLKGDLASISWPETAPCPERQGELWQHTCFECFLSRQDEPAYYEVNLSPGGNWNSFHFTGYRQGMEETPDLIASEIKLKPLSEKETGLSARLSLNTFDQTASMDFNLASVIEDIQGRHHYFALEHPENQPNFHARETFRKYHP